MTYTFYGQFQGKVAPGFVEALSGITVRLYRYRGTKYITSLAVADPSESMRILNTDAVSAKSSAVLGEARSDHEGNFTLIIDDSSDYNGEAFDVDLFIPDVPQRKEEQARSGIQLAITTMKPRWEETEEGFSATWAYTIPTDFWSTIRAHFDAWTLCGRVLAQEIATPVAGVHVTAYDADWLQDDCLGSATTDSEGKFRIDYSRSDFEKTPLSPLVNYEQGGPDLYFVVGSPSGERLLQEAKAAGHAPGRIDVEHCAYVELVIVAGPVMAM